MHSTKVTEYNSYLFYWIDSEISITFQHIEKCAMHKLMKAPSLTINDNNEGDESKSLIYNFVLCFLFLSGWP